MDRLELESSPRIILGKGVRHLRRQDLVPVNVYGHGIPSAAMQIEGRALVRALAAAGKSTLLTLVTEGQEPRTVLVRDIQRDPRSNRLFHVDFYQVKLTESIKLEVPIHFVGDLRPSLKGGALVHSLTAVQVECLPQNMPHGIEVDLGALEDFDQPIHVRDLPLLPKVTILSDPDDVVAKVEPPRVAEAVEAAPAAEEKPAEGAPA